MTVGPWKPITLEVYDARISEIDVRTQVSDTLEASFAATISYSSQIAGITTITVKDANRQEIYSSDKLPTDSGNSAIAYTFPTGAIDLWWPINYGAQIQYSVEVKLANAVGSSFLLVTHELRQLSGRRAAGHSCAKDCIPPCYHRTR